MTSASPLAPPAAVPQPARVSAWLGWVLAGAGLASAWWVGRAVGLEAASRSGYWLGVAGGLAMLGLFLYPLRKRWRRLRDWGAPRHWFVAHMVLGLAGPWLILVHCQFRAGSTNAAVALGSMLVVVLSGVVGRFLYVRVHRGLSQQRQDLASLRAELAQVQQGTDQALAAVPALWQTMADFEQAARAAAAHPAAASPWPMARSRASGGGSGEGRRAHPKAAWRRARPRPTARILGPRARRGSPPRAKRKRRPTAKGSV